MSPRKYPKTWIVLILLMAGIAYSYSWTYTEYGRLDYRAAVSLRLMSFEQSIRPDPNSDFVFKMPVNLIYGFSALLPKEEIAKISDIKIPGSGTDIPARMYWPSDPDNLSEAPPVIVYYHGGGFVVGSVDLFDPLARSLANVTKAIVISVDYRLAPAHPYPAAVDDAYTAVKWAAENAVALGGNPDNLVVAGDSAGGNLAAVVALKAKQEGGPPIAAQILYYPATDLKDVSYPSFRNFIDGYGLSSNASAAFHEAYLGGVKDSGIPYISPLYADSLTGLPPALIVTAGFDPLTDSARAYVQRLESSGVVVVDDHYPGMIHGFMSIGLFSQQRQALESTGRFLESLF